MSFIWGELEMPIEGLNNECPVCRLKKGSRVPRSHRLRGGARPGSGLVTPGLHGSGTVLQAQWHLLSSVFFSVTAPFCFHSLCSGCLQSTCVSRIMIPRTKDTKVFIKKLQ